MLYIRIQFTKTDAGSRSDCPVLDRYIKRAHWFYVDPQDVCCGYAALPDDCYSVSDSMDVTVVGKDEAIEFKKNTEAIHKEYRRIVDMANDKAGAEEIESALEAIDDKQEGAVRKMWSAIKGMFGF